MDGHQESPSVSLTSTLQPVFIRAIEECFPRSARQCCLAHRSAISRRRFRLTCGPSSRRASLQRLRRARSQTSHVASENRLISSPLIDFVCPSVDDGITVDVLYGGNEGLLHSRCSLRDKGEVKLLKLLGVQTSSGAAAVTLSRAVPPDWILTRPPRVTACRDRHFAPRVKQTPIVGERRSANEMKRPILNDCV